MGAVYRIEEGLSRLGPSERVAGMGVVRLNEATDGLARNSDTLVKAPHRGARRANCPKQVRTALSHDALVV